MNLLRGTRLLRLCATGAALALPGTFLLLLMHIDYPLVGTDSRMFLPRIFDHYLHARENGWWTIQWYTPSFGGGLPVFANPQTAQYSLHGLLVLLVDPWVAGCITIFMLHSAGTSAFYLCLRETFGTDRRTALFGALLFGFNGYSISRALVGHWNFHAYPLLAVLLYACLSSRVPRTAGIALSALVIAYAAYSGNQYVGPTWIASIAVAIPAFFCARANARRFTEVVLRLLLGSALGIAISAAKLGAVFSYLQYFPREIENSPLPGYTVPIMTQLIGLPVARLFLTICGHGHVHVQEFFLKLVQNAAGIWETDASLPFSGLLFIAAGVLFRAKRLRLSALDWRAALILGIVLWMLLDFICARGFWHPLLKPLPVIKSMSHPERFTVAFMPPLAVLAALSFSAMLAQYGKSAMCRNLLAAWAFGGIALSALLYCGSPPIMRFLYLFDYDVRPLRADYAAAKSDPRLMRSVDKISNVSDSMSFRTNSSSLRPVEPIFGYGLEALQDSIRPGPVAEVFDGAYNLNQPAALVFPDANGLPPFSRIPAEDRENFERFVRRQNPRWSMPPRQYALNAISALALLLVFPLLGWPVFCRLRGSSR